MSKLIVRELEERDIPAVAAMEAAAWHQYYSQYEELYRIIKDSVTVQAVADEWREFIGSGQEFDGKMVTGDDRKVYIASLEDEPIGIGAVSAYRHGVEVWAPVDDYIREEDGSLPKLAKYQNLYVHQDHRGKGIGHYLNLVRADYMLERGYTGIFLAPYADATKTMEFHEKNGLKLVHEYMSLSTFADDKRVKIACFVNLDLAAMRSHWQGQLDGKIAKGRAYEAA